MNNTKTFITVIAQQGKLKNGTSLLNDVHYEAVGNSRLEYEKKIRFPITAAIHGYAEKGDKVRVIAIRDTEDENLMVNFKDFFVPEMEAIREEKGIASENFRIETIDVKDFAAMNTDIELYEKLIDSLEDYEDLHICITYGIKSLPIILFAVASYASKVKKSDINCIIYGNLIRKGGDISGSEVHDMTSLFYRNMLFMKLADLGDPDPLKKLRQFSEE